VSRLRLRTQHVRNRKYLTQPLCNASVLIQTSTLALYMINVFASLDFQLQLVPFAHKATSNKIPLAFNVLKIHTLLISGKRNAFATIRTRFGT
jgi:hypothetical protein